MCLVAAAVVTATSPLLHGGGGTAGGASSLAEVVGTRGWLVIKKEGGRTVVHRRTMLPVGWLVIF